VIWSWPSQHIFGIGPFNSLLIKAERSEMQGYYLARLIGLLRPDVPLSLTGHSFGAKIVAASLQGLAAGHIAGQELPAPASSDGEATFDAGGSPIAPVGRSIQAALLAAAFDNTALLPGYRYGMALTQVDRMIITVNPEDMPLRIYMRCANGGVSLLGETGIPGASRLGELQSKVYFVSSTPYAGCMHHVRYYTGTDIAAILRPYFFYLDAPVLAP
jgi:hypothetical protein